MMPRGFDALRDAQRLCQGQGFGEQLRDVQKQFYESEIDSTCNVPLARGVLRAWGRPACAAESEATAVESLPGAVEPGSATASISASEAPVTLRSRRTSVASRLSQRRLESLQIETAVDTPKEKQRYGPERFFYDPTTYTGVHKNGPPTTVDKELVQQIVRDPSPRSRSASVASLSPRARAASASMTPRASGVFTSFKLVSPDGDSPRRRTIAGGSLDDIRYGPERFFYDQGTYTGTHRHGGPKVAEASEPVRRASTMTMTPRSPHSARGSTVSLASEAGSVPGSVRLRSPTGPSGVAKRLDLSPSSQDETKEPQSTRSMRSLQSMQSQGSPTSVVSPRNRAATETPRSARSASVTFKDSFRYGPERFFYDSRTYTGVHKHGGPTTLDLRDTDSQAGSPRVDSARSRAWSTMSSQHLTSLDA
ncbi:unnamed protein product [Symbiodinium natans]|uniref:Uncharacterized protein n=1 Tax=Symbiodinium natans TaxID=878477 RepID=A0A812IMM7_9DINO|nr:unnamed protein product [Symbiodinium natans]